MRSVGNPHPVELPGLTVERERVNRPSYERFLFSPIAGLGESMAAGGVQESALDFPSPDSARSPASPTSTTFFWLTPGGIPASSGLR